MRTMRQQIRLMQESVDSIATALEWLTKADSVKPGALALDEVRTKLLEAKAMSDKKLETVRVTCLAAERRIYHSETGVIRVPFVSLTNDRRKNIIVSFPTTKIDEPNVSEVEMKCIEALMGTKREDLACDTDFDVAVLSLRGTRVVARLNRDGFSYCNS